jgi:hypothetical protein
MTWVLIQKSQEVSWAAHQRIAAAIGETPPPGLLLYAAGEAEHGRWQAVSVWESEAAYETFVAERVVPAVAAMLGEDVAAAGPPPSDSFDAQHLLGTVVSAPALRA